MKKIILLTFLISFLLSSFCFASIKKETDDFHNKVTVYSQFDSSPNWFSHFTTYFMKDSNMKYCIRIDCNSSKTRTSVFSAFAEIKIDQTIYQIPLRTNGTTMFSEAWGIYDVPLELIPKIRNASAISIRSTWGIYVDNEDEILIKEVPNKKFEEWKLIIDTAPSDFNNIAK